MGHPEAKLLIPGEVAEILERGVRAGCTEALFTFGERPEEVDGFRNLLREIGYETIIDYLVEMCKLSIKMGLLPHSNPGVLEIEELNKLKPYNASMGLMLETVGKIDAHSGCPGKDPGVRIKTIENAGKLNIPFTTGILIGIGETFDERMRSIRVIGDLHWKFGHIQEVIIQNFAPKTGSRMTAWKAPGKKEMIKTVTMARSILPEDVAIQVSPNLMDPVELIRCGASDLGGISPETIDYINPEAPWPDFPDLKIMADVLGVPLRERLAIYPGFVRKKWYSEEILPLINRLSDVDGFRAASA
jgi:FO synthase subunit 1